MGCREPTRSCALHPDCGPHPLYGYYDERGCYSPTPRILVIGREPNAGLCMTSQAGPWLLRPSDPGAGRVAFWTQSHARISWAAHIPRLWLWPLIKRVRSSPIAYSDASPWGRVFTASGTVKRPAIPADVLERHAECLLGLRETQPDLCRVVVVSGRVEQYARFYEVIVPAFRVRGTVVADVPFFGMGPGKGQGVIVDAIMAQLERPEPQQAIQDTVRAWADQIDLQL